MQNIHKVSLISEIYLILGTRTIDILSLWAGGKFGLGSSYLPDTTQRNQKSVEQFNIDLGNIALNRTKEPVDKRH